MHYCFCPTTFITTTKIPLMTPYGGPILGGNVPCGHCRNHAIYCPHHAWSGKNPTANSGIRQKKGDDKMKPNQKPDGHMAHTLLECVKTKTVFLLSTGYNIACKNPTRNTVLLTSSACSIHKIPVPSQSRWSRRYKMPRGARYQTKQNICNYQRIYLLYPVHTLTSKLP